MARDSVDELFDEWYAREAKRAAKRKGEGEAVGLSLWFAGIVAMVISGLSSDDFLHLQLLSLALLGLGVWLCWSGVFVGILLPRLLPWWENRCYQASMPDEDYNT